MRKINIHTQAPTGAHTQDKIFEVAFNDEM